MAIPRHALKNSKCKSSREWKSLKRKQARLAKRAIDDLRQGCAYFPSDSYDVEDAAASIDRIIDDISVENFGS